MTRVRHHKRTRTVASFAAVAALVLAIPLGHYAPYRARALRETTFARVCPALPGNALEHALGIGVHTSEIALIKPRAEIENLFPSVSRTACEYAWKAVCARPSALRSLVVIVATMPEPSQALSRYTYAYEMLHQDSLAGNDFNDFQLADHQAYELTIENEVLVRLLDSDYVVDMQYHLCGSIGGPPAQALVHPLVTRLHLPILATSTAPSPPRLEP